MQEVVKKEVVKSRTGRSQQALYFSFAHEHTQGLWCNYPSHVVMIIPNSRSYRFHFFRNLTATQRILIDSIGLDYRDSFPCAFVNTMIITTGPSMYDARLISSFLYVPSLLAAEPRRAIFHIRIPLSWDELTRKMLFPSPSMHIGNEKSKLRIQSVCAFNSQACINWTNKYTNSTFTFQQPAKENFNAGKCKQMHRLKVRYLSYPLPTVKMNFAIQSPHSKD